MKKVSLLLLTLAFVSIYAQNSVVDFKTKNKTNQLERTEMLDLMRSKIKSELKFDVQFVVQHFKVSGDFAWLKADAKRLDGKEFVFENEGEYDCCHVEALFGKVKGKWTLVEGNYFSTDVWWSDIEKKFPSANKLIFKD
ncbi:MAG: hypothetical protein O9264_03585 [Leptospira sp.]|nr:hypothetical protein [Leptospira sp.]